MLKKVLTMALLTGISFSASSAQYWGNSTFAEKGIYSYISSISTGGNNMSYGCSVLKFESSNFTKIESIELNLDLKLEEDKLAFQDSYRVSLILSNGKMYQHKLTLMPNTKGTDKFKFFLSNESDKEILGYLQRGNYVNVEIADNNNKRMLYRFYLKDSMKSINKTQQDCDILYKTFK